jgi:branched-chain amino acid transport system substrate-binding protein
MTIAQMQQYASFMPTEMLFMSAEWPSHTTQIALDPKVEAAQKIMFDAYKAAGATPDNGVAHAWDPAMLIVRALNELGREATAEQLRGYIAGVSGWAGIDGIYDFTKMPQRGLDVDDAVVTRWQPDQQRWLIVSRPGGAAQ